jgi:hypothetical protein
MRLNLPYGGHAYIALHNRLTSSQDDYEKLCEDKVASLSKPTLDFPNEEVSTRRHVMLEAMNADYGTG